MIGETIMKTKLTLLAVLLLCATVFLNEAQGQATNGWPGVGNNYDPANYLGWNQSGLGHPIRFEINLEQVGSLSETTIFFGYRAGLINNSLDNIGIGYEALRNSSSISSTSNIAIGRQTLWANNGIGNIAIGSQALLMNTGAGYNTAIGHNALLNNNAYNNTAGGAYSMNANHFGENNTAFGFKSLYLNSDGNLNTAIGWQALYSNTGSQNTANGGGALYNNTAGGNNTATGFHALFGNISGNNNTALGAFADAPGALTNATAIGSNAIATASNQVMLGDANITSLFCKGAYYATSSFAPNMYVDQFGQIMRSTKGSAWFVDGNAGITAANYFGPQNLVPLNFKINLLRAGLIDPNGPTFFGYTAGLNNSGASAAITGFGFKALSSNTVGNFNTALGYQALQKNTTGSYNTAQGNNALFSNTIGTRNTAFGNTALASNISGNFNTAVGDRALFFNTATGNTAVGIVALYFNTTGYANTATGYRALYYNTGSSNTATGTDALFNNTTGGANTANGTGALNQNSLGSNNTAFGYQALFYNTTGTTNTAVGSNTLLSNTSGSCNTALGNSANVATATLNNATAIGCNAIANASNKIRLGDVNVTVIEGNPPVYTGSDGRFKTNVKEEVKGLDFIMKLRPVIYNSDTKKFDEFLMKNMPDSIRHARMGCTDYSESSGIVHTGFIAQEVQKAAMECGFNFDGVNIPKDENDNYSLAYGQFTVPLVKAVQELDKKDAQLAETLQENVRQNAELLKLIGTMQAKIEMLETQVNGCCELKSHTGLINPGTQGNDQKVELSGMNNPYLGQNNPNPFREETRIEYYIPQEMLCENGSCSIIFYDQLGRKIKETLVQAGFGTITLNTQNLTTGVYIYKLVIQDKVIDVRKMLFSK
jgi:trimeric autotransporter adhesin